MGPSCWIILSVEADIEILKWSTRLVNWYSGGNSRHFSLFHTEPVVDILFRIPPILWLLPIVTLLLCVACDFYLVFFWVISCIYDHMVVLFLHRVCVCYHAMRAWFRMIPDYLKILNYLRYLAAASVLTRHILWSIIIKLLRDHWHGVDDNLITSMGHSDFV